MRKKIPIAETELDGFGNSTASIETGTSSHEEYAAAAPNTSRTTRRIVNVARMDRVAATVRASRTLINSVFIFDLRDEALEIGDVTPGQLAVAAEVGGERCYPAS